VADYRQLVLAHTLAIMTAMSEEDLLDRTLAAACAVTDAPVALAIAADGTCVTHGSATLLADLDGTEIHRVAGYRGIARTLAARGLTNVATAEFADATIAVASPGQLAADVGSLLALIVAHAQAARDRLREVDLLARQAESDPLTGLRHHRPFKERLAEISPNRTAIIAIDVDQFKRINDEYGHQAGDRALVTLVQALTQALRDDDQLYRIGGDEFAVIVEVNGIGEAFAIARRLLDAARVVGQTISVGAALRLPGETGRETLLRADKALYEAKRSGRDTARVAA
jgi:diguanylate cyclase (GGDEF)-like protein